ncbi:alpha/beta hydrolase [Anaerolineales bacterium]
MEKKSAFAPVNGAELYYEIAGSGQALVMIHAGIADSRMWDHEFETFAKSYRVLRYDMRNYGQSKPVPEQAYRPIEDLEALLEYLHITESIILMGCSMGGELAMDFCLKHPQKVAALIMSCSGPSGLTLDVARPAQFSEINAAFEAEDYDRVNELELQVWVDGGRPTDQVDPTVRALVYEMNQQALAYEVAGLGERLPNAPAEAAAASRLKEIRCPVLIISGEFDTAYMQAAAEYMKQHIARTTYYSISDAAHLPNMEKPDLFHSCVVSFLNEALD